MAFYMGGERSLHFHSLYHLSWRVGKGCKILLSADSKLLMAVPVEGWVGHPYHGTTKARRARTHRATQSHANWSKKPGTTGNL